LLRDPNYISKLQEMKKWIYLGLCSAILFAGCKKDKTVAVGCPWPVSQFALDTVTDSLQSCMSIYGYTTKHVNHYDYFNPTFNPNNSNEFCFLRVDNQSQQRSIYTYDLCSQVLTHVTDNVFSDLSWSKKDWIAFSDGSNIWKVKSGGDSLTQLTFRSNSCYWPYWNPDGSKLAFFESTSASYEYIIDAKGNYIDTIDGTFGQIIGWRGADLCGVKGPFNDIQFVDGNLSTKQSIVLAQFADDFPPYGTDPFSWARVYGTDTIIWSCLHSTLMANLTTGSILATNFAFLPPKRYDQTFDAANGKIIISRSNRWIIDQNCNVAIRINLYMMNLDGSGVQAIVLPE